MGPVDNEESPTPYYSEGRNQKFEGVGHDTGSFGSGMYFKGEYPYEGDYDAAHKEMIRSSQNVDGRFIKVGNNFFRVDTSFYSNLYVLRSEKEGDLLKDLMNGINEFVRLFNHEDNYDVRSIKKRQRLYLYFLDVCSILGLRLPFDYKGMCRFAIGYCKDKSINKTPATIFMEMNGYNGVDATYGGKYNSYWEGSVIYDLSKVSGPIEPVKRPRDEFGLRYGFGRVASLTHAVLDGYNVGRSHYDKKVDNDKELIYALKRYDKVLPGYQYSGLPDDMRMAYLNILYRNICNGYVKIDRELEDTLCEHYYMKEIVGNGLECFKDISEKIARKYEWTKELYFDE